MKLAKKFKEYFFKKDNIVFSYNQKLYTVHFSDVFVFPQAFSATANYPDILNSKETVYILDIGGYTLDVLEMNSGKINIEKTQSYEYGVINLYNNLIKKMRGQDVRINENDIDDVILNRDDNIYISEYDKQYIRNTAQSFINGTLNKLNEDGYYTSQYKTVLLGGGSVLLKSIIEQSGKCTHSLFIEDIHCNAKRYELLAKRKLGE